MTRSNLLSAVLALLLVALGFWLASATEWTEVDVPVPPRGEAAQNPLYATQALARALGAQVVKRQGLEALPSTTSTLVLASRHWDVFGNKAEPLQDWVQRGGHLVLPAWLLDDEKLADWLPVSQRKARQQEPSPPRKRREKDSDCRALAQVPVQASGDAVTSLRVCGWERSDVLQGDGTPIWSLVGTRGPEVMRMALGKGSVTVMGSWDLLNNQHVLRHDNALAVAWALQMGAGVNLWFVAEESREALHTWLWNKSWVAMLLSLLALGAALWRGCVRFGVLRQEHSKQRRSMAEQVTGTGQFLQQHAGAALYRAQLRALDNTALCSLRQYASLSVSERAKAIATRTSLDANDMSIAMDASRAFKAHALLTNLHLLEIARRRLLAKRVERNP
jgi:hypothetical protein